MNDLLKVNYETETPTVSARDLHEALHDCKCFEEFFIKVCEFKCSFEQKDLRVLRDVIKTFVFRFHGDAITYLTDSITTEMLLPCKQDVSPEVKEKELQNELLNNFNNAFPEYKLLGSEIPVKGVGRIDILAEDMASGRPIIMELKVKSKSPNKQLIAYASGYENPILIGITENSLQTESKYKGIYYYTFGELKEGAQQWVN